MSDSRPIRCLILACGNPLRGDDGVGPWLAAWAFEHFRHQPDIRVIARQQWGPELAQDIAASKHVLFLDASATDPPGSVNLRPVEPAVKSGEPMTHHLEASGLLALSRNLYGCLPLYAVQLTVGVASSELGEDLSETVRAALPDACSKIQEKILDWKQVCPRN